MRDTTGTLYNELSKHSTMSIDTMDEEDAEFFTNNYSGVEFTNATSNQAICFSHWTKHSQVIKEAYQLAKSKFVKSSKNIPSNSNDPKFSEFVDQILLYSIAISGRNQLKHIKGKVMSQTRPSLSYNSEKTFNYAMEIIKAYEELGVSRDKVIIKIPVSWESMQSAKKLREQENVLCLGTVVHSLEQAIIAAEANCEFIAPYVDPLQENLDPMTHIKGNILKSYGYQNTVKIHKYYKAHNISTAVLIAAMIGLDTMLYCSGVDEMTISSSMLNKILNSEVPKDLNLELPVLKNSYTIEEAGPNLSFIGDRFSYYKEFNKNEVAIERYKFALDTFNDFDEKSAVLIKNTLIEYDLIKN